MEIKERLLEHFKIQDDLNKFLVGENWKDELEFWQLQSAIVSECGELVNSLGFKWWTKQEEDWENAKVELVDIWHFVLSVCLIYFKEENHGRIIDILIEEHNSMKMNYWYAQKKKSQIIPELSLLLYNLEYDIEYSPFFAGNMGTLIYLLDMTLEEFDELYRKKVELNKQRKLRGYDKDSSKKYIDGKEDNEFLIKEV